MKKIIFAILFILLIGISGCSSRNVKKINDIYNEDFEYATIIKELHSANFAHVLEYQRANYVYNEYFSNVTITKNNFKVKKIMDNVNENNWQIIFVGAKELKITILDDGNLLINIGDEVYVSKDNNETNIKNFKKELE